MARWKLTIEYDGAPFSGWQRQENGPSVQQSIEEAIQKFCGEDVQLHVAGRTDAGVHALGQVAHVDIAKPAEARTIRDAINYHLHELPVAIIAAEHVDDEFHARFHAANRVYCYKILMNRHAPAVIGDPYCWHIWKNLDVDAMNAAAKHLIGYHDFSSFRDAECQAKTPMRSIDRLEFIERKDNPVHGRHIELWAEAKSFLHHQIRNITGTLKLVGEGKWTPDDVKKILDAKNRREAGPTAPPGGLFFVRVDY